MLHIHWHDLIKNLLFLLCYRFNQKPLIKRKEKEAPTSSSTLTSTKHLLLILHNIKWLNDTALRQSVHLQNLIKKLLKRALNFALYRYFEGLALLCVVHQTEIGGLSDRSFQWLTLWCLVPLSLLMKLAGIVIIIWLLESSVRWAQLFYAEILLLAFFISFGIV